jgi:hypothetical protein
MPAETHIHREVKLLGLRDERLILRQRDLETKNKPGLWTATSDLTVREGADYLETMDNLVLMRFPGIQPRFLGEVMTREPGSRCFTGVFIADLGGHDIPFRKGYPVASAFSVNEVAFLSVDGKLTASLDRAFKLYLSCLGWGVQLVEPLVTTQSQSVP